MQWSCLLQIMFWLRKDRTANAVKIWHNRIHVILKVVTQEVQDIESLASGPQFMEPDPLDLERRLDNYDEVEAASICQGCSTQNVNTQWNWRNENEADVTDITPWDGATNFHSELQQPAGRIIVVKWGEVTRKIGIDGSAGAIKDAIRSAFGLRSKRSFWVEDEDGIVRSFDRAMPLTTYALHVDPGVSIKLYHYDECSQQPLSSEDATFYSEDDFREFLSKYGWRSLRQVGTCKDVESIAELRQNAAYHHSGFKS